MKIGDLIGVKESCGTASGGIYLYPEPDLGVTFVEPEILFSKESVAILLEIKDNTKPRVLRIITTQGIGWVPREYCRRFK
mgnify:CR=1 FL=1